MQGEQVWTWRSPIRGTHGNPILDGFTVPGRPLARERAQTRESRMVPWLLVLVLSRPVSRCLSAGLWLAAIRVGTGVQPLPSENYTYSRVLGRVHSYSSVTSIS